MRTENQKRHHAIYMKAYYKRHPEKKDAWKKWFYKYRKENKSFWNKFRKQNIDKFVLSRKEKAIEIARLKMMPCIDCGVQYNPWVMQFDHKDPSKKFHDVSVLQTRNVSMSVIKKEIEKCDLVCANCHFERSHRRSSAGENYRGIILSEVNGALKLNQEVK